MDRRRLHPWIRAIIMLIILMVSYFMVKGDIVTSQKTNFKLKDMNIPGYIGISFKTTSDAKKLINSVTLTSPSGETYDAKSANILSSYGKYNATFAVLSGETGTWKASYQKSLFETVIAEPYNKKTQNFILTDADIKMEKEDLPLLTFTAVKYDEKGEEINDDFDWNITINSAKTYEIISEKGTSKLFEPVKKKMNLPIGTWSIVVIAEYHDSSEDSEEETTITQSFSKTMIIEEEETKEEEYMEIIDNPSEDEKSSKSVDIDRKSSSENSNDESDATKTTPPPAPTKRRKVYKIQSINGT